MRKIGRGFGIGKGTGDAVNGKFRIAFLLLVLEAAFGGFYVTISRSITPIFLVTLGFTLKDLLMLSAFAGLLSLLVALTLYRNGHRSKNIKHMLGASLLVERVFWFLIPFTVGDVNLLVLSYSLAIALTIPSNIYMNIALFTFFSEAAFRRIIAYRTTAGSVASIIAQITIVSTLALGRGVEKYLLLYSVAFLVGLVSVISIGLAPISKSMKDYESKKVEESEIHANNIYLLLVMLLTSTNLLGIAWIPRLMRDLGAPDYLAASIGFVQTLTNIFASLFWVNKSVKSYRYAIPMLGTVPLLVLVIPIPYAHLGIAALHSFSLLGANFYASIGYANLVRNLGVVKAGILLPSANALAMMLAGVVGYLLVQSPILVFTMASMFSLLGLLIAFIALPELAIVPPNYMRMYSRILYMSSITSYNFIMLTVSETAKAVLRFTGLILGIMILLVIYRTIYYIMMLTGG